MTKAEALRRLRAREPDLRALGIEHLSLFGSVARGEERADSDIDLAVEFGRTAHIGLFGFAVAADRLATIMGSKIDLVCEPAAKPRVQAGIDKDRVRVF